MILIKHLIESMTELPLILGANTDETLVLSCSRNNINSSFLADCDLPVEWNLDSE